MFACSGKLVRWFGRGRVLRVSRRASAVGHGVRRVSQRVSSRNLASIYIIRRAKRRAFNATLVLDFSLAGRLEAELCKDW